MHPSQTQPEAGPQYPQFRFIEFNKRRQMRGAECARVEIIYSEGDMDCVWMSAGELQNNIRTWGPHEALTEALKAYGKGGRG